MKILFLLLLICVPAVQPSNNPVITNMRFNWFKSVISKLANSLGDFIWRTPIMIFKLWYQKDYFQYEAIIEDASGNSYIINLINPAVFITPNEVIEKTGLKKDGPISCTLFSGERVEVTIKALITNKYLTRIEVDRSINIGNTNLPKLPVATPATKSKAVLNQKKTGLLSRLFGRKPYPMSIVTENEQTYYVIKCSKKYIKQFKLGSAMEVKKTFVGMFSKYNHKEETAYFIPYLQPIVQSDAPREPIKDSSSKLSADGKDTDQSEAPTAALPNVETAQPIASTSTDKKINKRRKSRGSRPKVPHTKPASLPSILEEDKKGQPEASTSVPVTEIQTGPAKSSPSILEEEEETDHQSAAPLTLLTDTAEQTETDTKFPTSEENKGNTDQQTGSISADLAIEETN